MKVRHYLFALMIALNQMGNAIAGGSPEESISSRAGRAREAGSKMGKMWCGVFETFDFHPPSRADHCTIAVELHKERVRKLMEEVEE